MLAHMPHARAKRQAHRVETALVFIRILHCNIFKRSDCCRALIAGIQCFQMFPIAEVFQVRILLFFSIQFGDLTNEWFGSKQPSYSPQPL